jgi:hypothetical protein
MLGDPNGAGGGGGAPNFMAIVSAVAQDMDALAGARALGLKLSGKIAPAQTPALPGMAALLVVCGRLSHQVAGKHALTAAEMGKVMALIDLDFASNMIVMMEHHGGTPEQMAVLRGRMRLAIANAKSFGIEDLGGWEAQADA